MLPGWHKTPLPLPHKMSVFRASPRFTTIGLGIIRYWWIYVATASKINWVYNKLKRLERWQSPSLSVSLFRCWSWWCTFHAYWFQSVLSNNNTQTRRDLLALIVFPVWICCKFVQTSQHHRDALLIAGFGWRTDDFLHVVILNKNKTN